MDVLAQYFEDIMEQRKAPDGLYGIFCEPKGNKNRNSTWLNINPTSYDVAIAQADFMNRSNKEWHYYAKPIN